MREVDYDEYVQLYSSASEHQRVIRVVIFRVIKASFYVRIVQKYTIYCSRADVAQISKVACADLMTKSARPRRFGSQKPGSPDYYID